MTYKNWLEAVRQGLEDPCEYQYKERMYENYLEDKADAARKYGE